jgi:hypothetical protein
VLRNGRCAVFVDSDRGSFSPREVDTLDADGAPWDLMPPVHEARQGPAGTIMAAGGNTSYQSIRSVRGTARAEGGRQGRVPCILPCRTHPTVPRRKARGVDLIGSMYQA